MVSPQICSFLHRSKTKAHLLQILSPILKSALDYYPNFVSQFVLISCSIAIDFAKAFFNTLPITPPLFSWNVLIRTYVKSPTPNESLKLFIQLRRIGLKPDNFTYPFVVKACGHCLMLEQGSTVHLMVLKVGFDSDRYIRNSLLTMYATCGEIAFARKVFDEFGDRDVVSWSSMIAAYVANKHPLHAFETFRSMRRANEMPNFVTLVSLLSAAKCACDLKIVESIHAYIIANRVESYVALETALFETYAKCGRVDRAFQIFSSMEQKNLQSWTIMISVLADHGHGEEAISLFTQMQQIGLKPDSISFSAILSACSHMGLVHEGRDFFNEMVRVHRISPTLEHYGCVVDLFGRAGMVEEAYEVIKNMPVKPNSVILRSFIGACANHDRGFCVDETMKRVLLEMEPGLGSNYVLVANSFSLAECWKDAAELRGVMREKDLKKVPGCSLVGMDGGGIKEKEAII